MPIVADMVDAVVGGDTHRDQHTLELVTPTGKVLDTTVVANSDQGYAEALSWIADHVAGPRVLVALEGTRSYGIGLARAVHAAGWWVAEASPPHQRHRRRGKSDPIDAHAAALDALGMDSSRVPEPRADGDREALRIVLNARRELTKRSTRLVNALRDLLRSGPQAHRELARRQLGQTVLTDLSQPGDSAGEHGGGWYPVVYAEQVAQLATDLLQLRERLRHNEKRLAAIVGELAPALTGLFGVGTISAAQVIVSWSHPGRCRNEAAFAALAGTSPIPASSGKIVRHRLNRGGDRQLNRATQTIALARWTHCHRTHTYIAKRRSQGRTDREILRQLKRYITRELFKTLTTTPRQA